MSSARQVIHRRRSLLCESEFDTLANLVPEDERILSLVENSEGTMSKNVSSKAEGGCLVAE